MSETRAIPPYQGPGVSSLDSLSYVHTDTRTHEHTKTRTREGGLKKNVTKHVGGCAGGIEKFFVLAHPSCRRGMASSPAPTKMCEPLFRCPSPAHSSILTTARHLARRLDVRACPLLSLVAGDVKGNFAQLFGRVASVNANHGPFACVFCVGDFFGPDDGVDAAIAPVISGQSALPLLTYFFASQQNSRPSVSKLLAGVSAGGEVAPNLVYLGASGLATLHGLEVAFASDADAEGLDVLRERAPHLGGVDLLLTHEWPRDWYKQLADGAVPADLLADRDLSEVGSELAAELAVALRPRYHFCASEGQFWQRPPFRQGGICGHVCRLVAMAHVQPDKKQKWVHALSLVPMKAMAAAQLGVAPPGTTGSPYPSAPPLPGAAPPPPGAAGGRGTKRPRPDFVKDERPWVTQSCWFCMVRPDAP